MNVTAGDFPYQVSLQVTTEDNKHFCGASIIHPRFLLSAAHCFRKYKVPFIRAVAGAHNLTVVDENREQIRRVTRVVTHENYEASTWKNDIALLELDQSLDFDYKLVGPVMLRDPQWSLPGRNSYC